MPYFVEVFEVKTIVSILSFFVVSCITWGQADTVFVKYNKDKFEDTINYKKDFDQDYTDLTRNIIYLGGGRQGLTYLKYERLLVYKDWTQTIANIGLGGIPGDSEEPYNEPRHTIITSEIGQIFGYKNMFVEVGIEPAINIYGDVTYTDLNAILGLRYQSRTKELDGLFFQIGYNPRLYYSYKSDIDVPFYFGLGLNF
ncbi:MAG: hypothetical protein RL204_1062 [Bacteroidota bacterium]